jgi:hypothetical protein
VRFGVVFTTKWRAADVGDGEVARRRAVVSRRLRLPAERLPVSHKLVTLRQHVAAAVRGRDSICMLLIWLERPAL